MAGRLLDSRLAFLAAAPIAIPLGYAAAMWPLYALAGVGVFILLLLAVSGSSRCCSSSRPSCPWEGALAYPTESVSVVKLLGVLLFGAWLLRALVRSEPLRAESRARLGRAASGSPSGSRCCFAPDPADSIVRHAALRAVHRLLLPRPAAHAHDRGRAQAPPRASSSRARWPAALGHLRLRRARPRARRRADRGPERLRLPDDAARSRSPAYLLAEEKRRRAALGLLLRCCCSARRWPRCRAARWSGSPRSRRGRSSRAASRSAACCSASSPCSASRRSRSRSGRRCCMTGSSARATSPTRTSRRARRCGRARCGCPRTARSPGVGPGPLRDRGADLRAQQPDRAARARRPQLLSPRAGRDRRCSA